MRRGWVSVLCLLAALSLALMVLAGCGGTTAKESAAASLTVKVLDVGQGDAILIRRPE